MVSYSSTDSRGQLPDLRVRVPRGQLLGPAHSQRQSGSKGRGQVSPGERRRSASSPKRTGAVEVPMRTRCTASVIVVAAVMLGAYGTSVGMAAEKAKQGTALRTAWGDPDLQGTWT